MSIFGTLDTGEDVTRHVLKNDDLEVAIVTYGATVQSVRFQGGPNMALGFNTLAEYTAAPTYAGCIIGPVANRIAHGEAMLDDQNHVFDTNEAPHCLHSGTDGFHAKNWQVAEADDTQILLTLTAPDGEAGFPANRAIALRYEVVGASLWITILATTDGPTWMNMTHHGYWNLDGTRSFKGHELWVASQNWLAVDDDNIPTHVEPCPYDFENGFTLPAYETVEIDHNLVLHKGEKDVRLVASLTAPSGRKMEILTSEAGLQVYDGRSLPNPYSHLALEAQGFPDAPNRNDFPSVRLDAGETYGHITQYKFS